VFQKNSLYGFSESPSEEEINDFLNLSLNMTFTSFSEGKHESGDWVLNEKKIVLSKKNEEQNLYLIVKKITNNELVLTIDDPSDEEVKYLQIHLKN
jgi:hypothetical protein